MLLVRLKTLPIFLCLFFLFESQGNAATSYFVTQSGAGTRNGLSLGNSFSLSDFNGNSAPKGGDTVFFSGTITSTVTINSSGTGNGSSRLTLDFSAATLNTASPRINLGAHNFLNVLGGTLGTATSGALITSNNANCHDVTISNWTHTGELTSTAGFIDNTFGSNLVISNNTLDNIRTLFLSNTTSTHDIVISNNYARTSLNTTNQTDLVFLGDVYNVTIEGNKFIQRTQGATSQRHNDIIQTFQSGSSLSGSPHDWVIRYNWLELAVTGGSGDNSWLMMENFSGQALKIYGNVFIGTGGSLGGGNGIAVSLNQSSAMFYFYNNTVIRHQQPNNAIRFLSPGILFARNNVGEADAGFSGTLLQWTMTAGAPWDRNFFYQFPDCSSTYRGPNGSCTIAPNFIDFTNNNVAVRSTSPLIGAGDSTIGSEYNQGIAPGSIWPNPTLVTRSAFDVGAYVFSSAGDTTAPSVSITLQSN